MFGAKTTKPQSRIDTLIGAGTRIEGNLHFVGGLRIDGQVKGNVVAEDSAGTLILSEQALIEGEVRVAHAVINGSVNGPIHGLESVELQPKANVTGDVQYKTLEVHLGAIIQGRLLHSEARSDKVVALKPASAD